MVLMSIPCCCFPPGATSRFSQLRGRALRAGGQAAVRGLQAGGASGPAAGMPPGAGVGMRGATGAVARHPVRPEAPLPRLLRLAGGHRDSTAAGQPRRQHRQRRRHDKPGPVRQEQSPGADGGVEKLQQLVISGLGAARLFILPPPPDFTSTVRRAVIATESS
ncbi:trithorax group protein osa-like isoform X1 [Poecile atricapillus]|uniref:trithorax group protein osa-like isoform X1 n=1 Tax=Poecile atricapillus TaxID=48891 RepID=UPI002739271D|nr:trithorax group protein osa-like isoform X1 [Poecile atricapillus]